MKNRPAWRAEYPNREIDENAFRLIPYWDTTLDQTLINHGISYFNEPTYICTFYILI